MGIEVGIVMIGCIFISLGFITFITIGLGSILIARCNKEQVKLYKKFFLLNILFGIIYYIFFIDDSQLIMANVSEEIINTFPGETLGDRRFAYEQDMYIKNMLIYLQIFFKLTITIMFPTLIAISISKYFNFLQVCVFLCIVSFGLLFPLDMLIMPLNTLNNQNLELIQVLMISYHYIIALSTIVLIANITIKKINKTKPENKNSDNNINKKLINIGMIFTFLGWSGLNFILFINMIYFAIAVIFISYNFWFYLNKKFNNSNSDDYYLGAIIGTIGFSYVLIILGVMINFLLIITMCAIIFLIFKLIEKRISLNFETKFHLALFLSTILVSIYIYIAFDIMLISVELNMKLNALEYLLKNLGIAFWSGIISFMATWICSKLLITKTA